MASAFASAHIHNKVDLMATDSEHENSSTNKNARLRRRGIYTLKKIDKLTKNGQKILMHWNTKGQPIGPYRSIFQHFINHQTRSRVSISISSWIDVPKEIKSLIWKAVMIRLILLSASKKWSDFKHITTNHLFTNTKRTQIRTEPPLDYPFIGRDTWAESIKQRWIFHLSEEIRGLNLYNNVAPANFNDRNSKSAKLNDYPFRSARKSYASIEEELLIEQGLDPTTSSLPRHELWLAARKWADDGYEPRERWEKCSLFWPNLSSKVNEGHVLVPLQGKVTMLHCQPLKPDRVKVLVDDPILPNVNVPFPTEEFNVVFEAKGTPVAWPKDLVVAQNQNVKVTTSPSRKGKQVDKNLCQPSQHVKSLENYLNERRSSNNYGFLCPAYLADVCKSEEEKARYMANCMSKPERKKCVWFAPYKDGFHWALAVINPWDNIVYLLDPLRKGAPGNKFKDMVHA
ncbi:hypothetical protein CASFOL_041542 [Castilleja foliolosa]|uniref:DUF8039 domain-containing protein n=1 Tax=Castilleja foliolosa TaxID=1961234 RepID=A0ABD3BBI2_9LAMI